MLYGFPKIRQADLKKYQCVGQNLSTMFYHCAAVTSHIYCIYYQYQYSKLNFCIFTPYYCPFSLLADACVRQVEARKRKIAEIVAKRAASLEGGDDNTLRVHPTGSTREGLGAASTCYSGRPELLERNPIDTSLGRERCKRTSIFC